jgi:hypothetical protein
MIKKNTFKPLKPFKLFKPLDSKMRRMQIWRDDTLFFWVYRPDTGRGLR